MWPIEQFAVVDVELDFSSSAQGRRWSKAVRAEPFTLVNAVSYVDFDEDPTQVVVCDCCGFTHCAPGGWVCFRRVGEYVALIPAFERMTDGEWEMNEYQPPHYLASKGAPILSLSTYVRLRAVVSRLPAPEQIKPLTAREAVRLMQFEAPLQVLGKFPDDPCVARETIIAMSVGDPEVQSCRLQSFIDEHKQSARPVRPVREAAEPVEFYLDGPGFPVWRPVAECQSGLAFNLQPVVAVSG